MPHADDEKVTSRDIPRLLALLTCGDAQAQQNTLRQLCPCRNVRYDKEVWLAIFRAHRETADLNVRDQAAHAIETLRERARTDPRSQELLRWLLAQEVDVSRFSLENAIPEWRPTGRAGLNGLYIPRYEAPSRTRKNRPRR